MTVRLARALATLGAAAALVIPSAPTVSPVGVVAPPVAAEAAIGRIDLSAAMPGAAHATSSEAGSCRELDGHTLCQHATPIRAGADRSVPSVATLLARAIPSGAATVTPAATPGIACSTDGVSGKRVQALYVYVGTSRYKQIAPLIRNTYVPQVDKVFSDSSLALGGPLRRVRWVTSSTCTLSVIAVKVTSRARLDLSYLRAQLVAKGYSRSDRLYLAWFDTDGGNDCGVGEEYEDSRPGSSNVNNRGPRFAEAFTPCWGQSWASYNELTEAHELMHMLGAVQPDAPHATPSGHCYDEWDLMCYRASGDPPMKIVCSRAWFNRFDCNGDDYFDPSPKAGSWLAKHWNTANSPFLIRYAPALKG